MYAQIIPAMSDSMSANFFIKGHNFMKKLNCK